MTLLVRAAFLPFIGQLCNIFGRRWMMISCMSRSLRWAAVSAAVLAMLGC